MRDLDSYLKDARRNLFSRQNPLRHKNVPDLKAAERRQILAVGVNPRSPGA
jgi:hypothetical protein